MSKSGRPMSGLYFLIISKVIHNYCIIFKHTISGYLYPLLLNRFLASVTDREPSKPGFISVTNLTLFFKDRHSSKCKK